MERRAAREKEEAAHREQLQREHKIAKQREQERLDRELEVCLAFWLFLPLSLVFSLSFPFL